MVIIMSDVSDKFKIEEFLNKAKKFENEGNIEDAVKYYAAALYFDQGNEGIQRKLYELKRIRFVKFFPHPVTLVEDVSYDGRYLPLIFDHNRELFVLDLETGLEVFRLSNEKMGRVFWFPGTHYLGVITLPDRDFVVIDVDSGDVRRLFNIHELVGVRSTTGVACTRDRSKVLISIADDGFILVKDPLTRPELVFIDEEIYCSGIDFHPSGEYVLISGDEANYIFKFERDKELKYVAKIMGPYREAGLAIWDHSGTHLYMHYDNDIAVINFARILEDIESGRIDELWEEYRRRFIDEDYFYNYYYIEARLHIIDFLTDEEDELVHSSSEEMKYDSDEISYYPSCHIISPDDRYMACIYGRTMIGIWDLKRREVVYKWRMRKAIEDDIGSLDALQDLSWLGNQRLVVVWLSSVAILDLW